MRTFAVFISFLSLPVLLSCSDHIASNSPQNQAALQPKVNPNSENLRFTNAYWYSVQDDQISFQRGDRYSVGGVFTSDMPASFTSIDLSGRYIIPPFGEAHNHSVDGLGTEKTAVKYLDEGVFYYKNPNSIYSFTQPLLSHWQRVDTLDVSFSYGGLSKDEGHPEKLYRQLSSYGMYSDFDPDSFEGNAFYDVDSVEKLDQRWQQILSNKPDFLKLYLLKYDSDENAGLSEGIFREIVKRAQALNIRTSVHVETVQDLELAVDAGATEAAHLPAYNLKVAKARESAHIPDALIKRMSDQKFIVVTTTNVSARRGYPEADYALVANQQVENLKRLLDAGVPIAIGSDSYFETAMSEINTLRKIGAFDDRTLLKLWIDTPRLSIFPERSIGRLNPGYEASFIALECNPIENFDCIQQIHMKVKQGAKL